MPMQYRGTTNKEFSSAVSLSPMAGQQPQSVYAPPTRSQPRQNVPQSVLGRGFPVSQ